MNLETALLATGRAICITGTKLVDLNEPTGWRYQMLVLVDPKGEPEWLPASDEQAAQWKTSTGWRSLGADAIDGVTGVAAALYYVNFDPQADNAFFGIRRRAPTGQTSINQPGVVLQFPSGRRV
jgi:hypothetical protein